MPIHSRQLSRCAMARLAWRRPDSRTTRMGLIAVLLAALLAVRLRMRTRRRRNPTPSGTDRAAADSGAGPARLAAVPSRSGRSEKDPTGVGHARRAAAISDHPAVARAGRKRSDQAVRHRARDRLSRTLFAGRLHADHPPSRKDRLSREPQSVSVFAYDWRRSVFDNAKALEAFVREKVPDGKVDILAHSHGRAGGARLCDGGRGRRARGAAVQRGRAVPGLGEGVPDRARRAGGRSIMSWAGSTVFAAPCCRFRRSSK